MSVTPEMLMTWRGRLIEELSREELIDALRQVGAELENSRERHISSIRLMADLHRAVRQCAS